jgi:tetratricopeptide (TPR) repeat protein/transcriptional regulator with XRE-family HTH domain
VDDGVDFGGWVRQRRTRLVLTQEELAERAQVSVRTIQMLEAGRLPRHRPATRRRLTDALGHAHEALGRAEVARPVPGLPLPPGQLPAAVHGFAGRHAELARLDTMLHEAEGQPTALVVVLCGMAGVGKTSLAVHWAHRAAHRFDGGQLHVDLRGFDPAGTPMEPSAAARMFLGALGAPPASVPAGLDEQAALYRTLLAGRRTLVLLDNARDADQVRPLLPGSADSLVLVTSRDPLTSLVVSHGARPVVLDVLPPSDARELLARRIGADRLRREPAATEEIIGRCAGLPLALSVIAARAAVRSGLRLSWVASQLREERLDGLDGGDRVSDVRAVLSWSYQILRAEAARMFRMLGLHPVPEIGTLAAASLVGTPVRQARAALAELTRAHLVTELAPGRYRCHDVLREYAAEQANAAEPAAEREAALGRLLDHYLDTANRAARALAEFWEPVPPEPEPARDGAVPDSTVDVDTEDRAAEWFRTWQTALLAAVERAAERGLYRQACRLAVACAAHLQRIGAWHEQVTAMRLAVAAAGRIDDLATATLAHAYLGQAYTLLDRLHDARTELGRAGDLARRLGDELRLAQVHQSLAVVADRQGQHRESLDHAERACESYHRSGDPVRWALALSTVGWYHARCGEYEQALVDCRRALALHEEHGSRHRQASTLHSLGYAHHHVRQYAEALGCYRRSASLCRELGIPFHEAQVLNDAGDTHLAAGDRDAARAAWQAAAAIFDELGHSQAGAVRGKLTSLDAGR